MCPDAEGCLKVKLQDFCSTNFNFKNKYLHSYISTVSLKIREFVKQILPCESSGISSEKYLFETVFLKDGSCQLDGLTWPTAFQKLNFGNEEDGLDQALSAIEFGISTASNMEEIKSIYKLSDSSARRLKELVDKFQTKDLQNGFQDKSIPLPNLLLMMKVSFVHNNNKLCAKRLLEVIRECLSKLSEEDIRKKSSKEVFATLQKDQFASHPVEGDDSELKPESSNYFQSLLAKEPTVPRLRRTVPCSPGTWRTLEPGPMSKVIFP